ncbi:M56 family metallopeptidase [Spirosoma sp.]|uniref:M56 family metallopeptidase n=1 Tax=Spirosoma sp. TaxID=1899569 RepID=UPI00261A3D16|nr:M56 family metallopeptidase [Spirosoma sp.]MCX6214813.1 M56 family metallopeptidase [Spirosoma sp.]
METLRYLVLVNGLLAVVSVAFYILLRRETFFSTNRLALWLGLASALIMPLVELPDWRPQPVRSAMQRTAQVIIPNVLPEPYAPTPEVTIMFPNRKTYRAFQALQPRFVWSWQTGMAVLYFLGVFLLFVRFVSQLLSLRKLIRGSTLEPYTDFILVHNASITTPFSFFGWVFVSPDQHTTDELDQILRHERVHVRERHSFDMLGAELVCILFWYNPAAYLFRKLLQQTLEFSADRAVLAEGIDAKLYQYNLLKVSLAGGQSSLTNHFSRSQLKSRIIMLNQPKSTKLSWFKYPVFVLAALTVASAFARPQVEKLAKHVAKPISDILSITDQSVTKRIPEPKPTPMAKLSTQEDINPKIPIKENLVTDSSQYQSQQQPSTDLARVSPSRYMVYQGDYLYWIVTPKTTFDDFFLMKQEFAKQGYTMQLNEVKLDPLSVYIDRVSFTLQRPAGSPMRCEELNSDGKPIPTLAGYIYLKNDQIGSSRLEGRYSKRFPLYQTEGEKQFPDLLRSVAATDNATMWWSINEKGMEYMVLDGQRKYGHLGSGFRRFDKEDVKRLSSLGDAITVRTDGSISVNNAANDVEVFINNEPVSSEAIQQWKISQLYTVASILGYDSATNKRSGITYLLFYVERPNK